MNQNEEQKKLMTKIIEASEHIHKNTKLGKPSYILANETGIRIWAEMHGLTIEEATERIERYFKGQAK